MWSRSACLKRVKSGPPGPEMRLPLYPREQTRPAAPAFPKSAIGLNRFAIVVAAGGAANRVLGCERPFLRIEGFSTSPKTGASHDQRDDEPVTPAHDRRHDDPQFRAEDPPRLYPQRQEPDCVSRPLA